MAHDFLADSVSSNKNSGIKTAGLSLNVHAALLVVRCYEQQVLSSSIVKNLGKSYILLISPSFSVAYAQ